MTFDELYRAHVADVQRFALYLTGDPSTAKDITAETFVRAWASDAPTRASSVRAYLLTVARNLHRREWRRHGRFASSDVDPVDDTPGPERTLEARGELHAALIRLQAMPEIDRAALLMRAVSDLPYIDIALALGITVSAAKVKVHRARAVLQADRNSR